MPGSLASLLSASQLPKHVFPPLRCLSWLPWVCVTMHRVAPTPADCLVHPLLPSQEARLFDWGHVSVGAVGVVISVTTVLGVLHSASTPGNETYVFAASPSVASSRLNQRLGHASTLRGLPTPGLGAIRGTVRCVFRNQPRTQGRLSWDPPTQKKTL